MYRSTVPHSWRQTWAAIGFLALAALAGWWLTVSPLLWLLRALGPFEWTGPVAA